MMELGNIQLEKSDLFKALYELMLSISNHADEWINISHDLLPKRRLRKTIDAFTSGGNGIRAGVWS